MTDDSAMEEGRLEEIEARCNKATPGPWGLVEEKPEFGEPYFAAVSGDGNRTRCAQLFVDADFISCSRTDVPDLLAEVLRLRAENDALKQQLQALRHREEKATEITNQLLEKELPLIRIDCQYFTVEQWAELIAKKIMDAEIR